MALLNRSGMGRAPVVGVAALLFAVLTGVWWAPASTAQAGMNGRSSGQPLIVGRGFPSAVAGSYLVGLRSGRSTSRSVRARAEALSVAHHGRLGHVWDGVLPGFSVRMSEADAEGLAVDPNVSYVEQEQRWRVDGSQVQDDPDWGLDRVDQRSLPVDHTYTWDTSIPGVSVYILDTGIRLSHKDLKPTAVNGWDFVDNDQWADDTCNGHGTAVAGILGGQTYGVARNVTLIGVRVFGCDGTTGTTSIHDGLHWVIDRVLASGLPAVINLSLAPECVNACPPSTAITELVQTAIALGVPVVASAGATNQDACGSPIPATLASITVGGTSPADARWVESSTRGSNFGSCVDIWAPAQAIQTDGSAGDTATITGTGTSFAVPFVAGAVALLMATPPFANLPPPDRVKGVTDQLLALATTGALTNLGAGSPDRLVFVSPPVPSGSSVALARQPDGRLGLYGVNQDAFLFWRVQQGAGSGSWGTWTQSVAKGWVSVAAQAGGDGRHHLTALTLNEIGQRQQAAPNGTAWFNWQHVDRPLQDSVPRSVKSITVAANKDGRLTMFVTTSDGDGFTSTQKGVGSTTWAAWTQLAFTGGKLRSTSAALAATGRIELAAVDSTGHVWSSTQTAANTNSWSSFAAVNPVGGGKRLTEV